MTVWVLVVGRARGPLAGPVEEFEARAARYWKLRVREVPGESGPEPRSVREREGRRLLAALPDDVRTIVLTRRGRGMTSEGLARYLERMAVRSQGDVAFVVGGAHGLSMDLLDRADFRLSLSPMTLPRDMARLILAEQLYRAGTIRAGEPYHKGGP